MRKDKTMQEIVRENRGNVEKGKLNKKEPSKQQKKEKGMWAHLRQVKTFLWIPVVIVLMMIMIMIFVLYVKDTFTLRRVSSVIGFRESNAMNGRMKIAICTEWNIVQANIHTCILISFSNVYLKTKVYRFFSIVLNSQIMFQCLSYYYFFTYRGVACYPITGGIFPVYMRNMPPQLHKFFKIEFVNDVHTGKGIKKYIKSLRYWIAWCIFFINLPFQFWLY